MNATSTQTHGFFKNNMISVLRLLSAMLAVLTVVACSTPPVSQPGDPAELSAAIQGLDPEVDPEEAARAARIAYEYPLELARQYRITDPPIVHNAKIYQGYRERGLCNDWTEDLSKRLRQEQFQTLTIHWATSPPTAFRIIHHSVVISARGGTIDDGLLLDPWRYGGPLFWATPASDTRYDWRPRMEVREELIRNRSGSTSQ